METDVWGQVDESRKELVTMLEQLEPADWDRPSLCDAWRVRDVAAHLETTGGMSKAALFKGMLANGMSFNRWNAKECRRRGEASIEDLISGSRGMIGIRTHPPLAKPTDVLTDYVVHMQDIRRPLGIAVSPPVDRTVAALEHVKANSFPFGTKKRIAGLRLVATDADWSHGEGPVVEGPAEALLMVMVGRAAALDDLAGDGVATLRSRM